MAWSCFAGDALAGGSYDPKTGLFQLSYSYARLPNSGGVSGDELLRDEVPRTAELDALVAQFYLLVSEDLGKVTNGKGYLAPLQYTDDIRKADVILSPDTPFIIGNQYRGGWGTLNGFTSNSGQLAIYIESLRKGGYSSEGQRLTVVHELCHYLFGLPDEYNVTGSNCPVKGAPSGLGCLMDNYNTRTWPGKLCNDLGDFTHNPGSVAIPTSNTPASKSCQAIVDDFFTNLGVDKNARFNSPTGLTAGATNSSGSGSIATDIAAKVQDKARTLINDQKAQGTTPKRDDLLRKLSSFAFDLLKDQGSTANLPPLQQIATLALESVGLPPIVPKALEALAPLFEAEAKRLAQSLANKPGRPQAILNGLLTFASKQSGSAPGTSTAAAPGTSTADDTYTYLNDLANQAAATNDSQVLDPAKVQLQYFNMLAARLDAILIENNVPGAVDARIQTRALEAGLAKIGLMDINTKADPFRTARATLVIAPPITEPYTSGGDLDLIPIHPGELVNYNDLRYECIFRFNKLVDRARIQPLFGSVALDKRAGVSADDSIAQYGATVQGEKASGSGIKGNGRTKVVNQQTEIRKRQAVIASLLNLVYQEIRKDTVQNVVLLIPPGGLPVDLTRQLEILRPLIIGKTDLRLDIVQIGTSPIPRQLRDFASRSDGSVLTVTDQDEVGAIIQRLANDQSQGTWINLPLQGAIYFQDPEKFRGPNPPANPELNNTLFQRMNGERTNYPIGSVIETDAAGQFVADKDLPDEIRLALRPFYVDSASDFQFIIGLSTNLNVASADNEIADQDIDLLTPKIELVAKQINVSDASEREPLERSFNRPFRSVAADNLTFDADKSSRNLLIFNLPAKSAKGVGEGWYTPVLVLKKENFAVKEDKVNKIKPDEILKTARDQAKALGDAQAGLGGQAKPKESSIHFTASIGTSRTNAQLIPQLVQDAVADPILGSLPIEATQAVVQAQMLIGAPVKGAKVTAYYQRIETGVSPIQFKPFTVKDDGAAPDKAKDDGIYTGMIDLVDAPRYSADYRVVFAAEYQDGTSFIDLAESMPTGAMAKTADPLAKAAQANVARGLPVPKFQRATSLNFRVTGERGERFASLIPAIAPPIEDEAIIAEAPPTAPPTGHAAIVTGASPTGRPAVKFASFAADGPESASAQAPIVDDDETDEVKKATKALEQAKINAARESMAGLLKDYQAKAQAAEDARTYLVKQQDAKQKAAATVRSAQTDLDNFTQAETTARQRAAVSKAAADTSGRKDPILVERAQQDQTFSDAASRQVVEARYKLAMATASDAKNADLVQIAQARFSNADGPRATARELYSTRYDQYKNQWKDQIDLTKPPATPPAAGSPEAPKPSTDKPKKDLKALVKAYDEAARKYAEASSKPKANEPPLKAETDALKEAAETARKAMVDAANEPEAPPAAGSSSPLSSSQAGTMTSPSVAEEGGKVEEMPNLPETQLPATEPVENTSQEKPSSVHPSPQKVSKPTARQTSSRK